MRRCRTLNWLTGLIATIVAQSTLAADTIQDLGVDFSQHGGGADLSKSFLGVYQTPFWFLHHRPDGPDTSRMLALTREAGVRDLRYELALGKPDVFPAEHHELDPFFGDIAAAQIQPLIVLCYCPTRLQTGAPGWDRWKQAPADVQGWSDICRAEAGHVAGQCPVGPSFEVWNEPDLPGDGGKVFFAGNPADYGRIYSAASTGVRAGAPTCAVGGPAIAYNTSYLAKSGILNQPIDFVSIHAYGNAPAQLANIRLATAGRTLPIRLTEYASFPPDQLARNRSPEAVSRFFADVKGLLSEPQLQKVYWAQWVDESIGMLSETLQRRPLFSAYAAYQTLLPTSRRAVSPNTAKPCDALASADGPAAAVVVWNPTEASEDVHLDLQGLTNHGAVRLFWIGYSPPETPAAVADGPLAPTESFPYTSGRVEWRGRLPVHAAVLLRMDAVP